MPAGMDPVIAAAAPILALPAGKEGKAQCDAAPPPALANATAVGLTPEKASRAAAAGAAASLAGLSLVSPAGAPETPAPRAYAAAPAAAGASPVDVSANGDDLLASPPRLGAARRGLSFPSTDSTSPTTVMACAAAVSPLPSRPGLGVARASEGDDTSAGAPFVEPLLDPADDRFTMYPIKCVLNGDGECDGRKIHRA
jgi:hypothetical protein